MLGLRFFIKRRSCSAGRQGCYLKCSIHPPKAHQPPHWQGCSSPSLSQPSVCLYKIIAILALFGDWTKEQVGCGVRGCLFSLFSIVSYTREERQLWVDEWAAAGTRWPRGLRNTPWGSEPPCTASTLARSPLHPDVQVSSVQSLSRV